MRRSIVVAAIVVSLGAVVSACGGSSAGSTSGSSTASSTHPSATTAYAAAVSHMQSLIAGTVNLLAASSQTRSPSDFARLQQDCRMDQQVADQIQRAPLPSGASPSAVAARDQAVATIKGAVQTCLGNLADEPRSVLPQILGQLSQGSSLLFQAQRDLTAPAS